MVAVELYQLTQSIAGCTITVGFTNSGCFLESPNVPPEMKAFAANGWFVEVSQFAKKLPRWGDCLMRNAEL